MPRAKFDRAELHRLLVVEKKSQKEVAKIFHVSIAAISMAVKKLGIETTKTIAMPRRTAEKVSAEKVLQQSIDAIKQLIKINSYANEMLDMLMRWQRGEKEALQLLESQVRRVRIRDQEEDVAEYRFKDPRDLAIRLMAEIRCQLSLYLEIFSSLYDMEAFKEFKEAFLNSIGKVNPEVRDSIIAHLQKQRLLPTGF
jgi:predicted transcriptional regulator